MEFGFGCSCFDIVVVVVTSMERIVVVVLVVKRKKVLVFLLQLFHRNIDVFYDSHNHHWNDGYWNYHNRQNYHFFKKNTDFVLFHSSIILHLRRVFGFSRIVIVVLFITGKSYEERNSITYSKMNHLRV